MTAVDLLTLRVLLEGDDSHLNSTLAAANKAIDDFIKKPRGSVNLQVGVGAGGAGGGGGSYGGDPAKIAAALQAKLEHDEQLHVQRVANIQQQGAAKQQVIAAQGTQRVANAQALSNQRLEAQEEAHQQRLTQMQETMALRRVTTQRAAQQRIEQLQNSGYRQLRAGAILTTAFTLPIVAGGAAATHFSAEFEASMAHSAALTEIGRRNIELYKKQILDLVQDDRVRSTPKELGDAFFFAASKTKSGADAMGVLRASAIGAAGGLGTVQEVVEGTTTVLNAYKMSGDQAAHVTDIFVQSAKEGGVSAETFARALPKVVATAAAIGVPLEQVAASIATMTRVGIPAGNAATALNRLLLNMEKPSKQAEEAVSKLGTSFHQLREELQTNGLLAVLDEVMKKANGQPEVLARIFGSVNSFRAVLATAGSQADTYAHILEKMYRSEGASVEAAATASKTFEARLDHLKSVAQATAIEVGDRLLPSLVRVADNLSHSLPAAIDSSVRAWDGLPPELRKVTLGLIALLALAGPMQTMIGTSKVLAAAMMTLSGVGMGEGGALTLAAANPAVMIAGIAAAVVGYKAFGKTLQDAEKAEQDADASGRRLTGTLDTLLKSVPAGSRYVGEIKKIREEIALAGNDTGKLNKALADIERVKHQVTIDTKMDKDLALVMRHDLELAQQEANEHIIDVKVAVKPFWQDFGTNLGRTLGIYREDQEFDPQHSDYGAGVAAFVDSMFDSRANFGNIDPAGVQGDYLYLNPEQRKEQATYARRGHDRTMAMRAAAQAPTTTPALNAIAGMLPPLPLGPPSPTAEDQVRMARAELEAKNRAAAATPKTHGGAGAATEEDSKAKAARLKREKDALRDTAKSWEEYAGNVSDSVEKALDAATKLRDGMRETIDPMKQQLIQLGIIDDPLGPYVTAFEQGLVRLDARLKHFAAGAKRQLDFAGDKSDAAKKTLNKMQGGDGELPDADRVAPGQAGSRGGGALPPYIRAMLEDAGKMVGRNCAEEVTHVFNQTGIPLTATRLAQMSSQRISPDASGRYPEGAMIHEFPHGGKGPYKEGHYGFIHYQNGTPMMLDSNFVNYPKHDYVGMHPLKARDFSRAAVFMPPGYKGSVPSGAGGGVFPGLQENPGKDAEGRINAILGGSFDASLSKIAAVPKAWGAAVRDTEGSQARFALQTRLTSVEFQRYMQAIASAAGVSVDDVVKYFKQLANQTDYLANIKRATYAAQDFSRDTDKQTRILRAGNDPLADLRERMAQGDLSKAPEADRLKAWTSAVRLETQKLDTAAKDYNETTRIEILGVRAGSEALREHSGNLMEAARATALVTEKEQFRRQLEKQPLTDAEKGRRLDAHMSGFAQAYDDRQRGSTFSDYTQRAKQLQDAIAALNNETIQGAVDRELAAREDQRWMDPQEKAELRRLMIAEKMGELDKAHSDKMRELGRTGANLRFEGGIIGQGLSDRATADQVQTHNATQARYNELVDKGVEVTKALRQARQEAFSDELNRRLQQANEQAQALNNFTRDAAGKLALQHDIAGVQGANRIGSPDYEREIYRVTELNRLNEEYKKGAIGPVVNQMLDKSMQVYDAEHGTAAAGQFKQQLEALQRDMSILGDSTGLAALQFDLLFGQFSKVENKGQLLTDTLRNLQATIGLDTTRQLLGDASQERQRFIHSSRGRLDEELRTRDAGEQARVAAGGTPLPAAYTQAQGAQDDRRRAAADLEDSHARLIHNLEAGRDIQLETARTEQERVAIAQKYEALMRDVLGVTETQAEVQQDADERANARLKDRAETIRHEADGFEQALGNSLYASLTGQRDPIRSFFKSLWDDIARDASQQLSHAVRERIFGRAQAAVAGQAASHAAGGTDQGGLSVIDRASDLMGGIGSVPFFTPPFAPNPQRYPGAQKPGGAIADLAKQQLSHATIHVVNATSTIGRATIHAPGAMIDAPGGTGGGGTDGGGSSNSNEQIISAVAQLWNT